MMVEDNAEESAGVEKIDIEEIRKSLLTERETSKKEEHRTSEI